MKIFRTVLLVAGALVLVIVLLEISPVQLARKTDTQIKALLLEMAPFGTPKQEIVELARKKGWTIRVDLDNFIGKHGEKTKYLRVELGEYRPVFIMPVVTVQVVWWFTEDGRLKAIEVEKTVDSL